MQQTGGSAVPEANSDKFLMFDQYFNDIGVMREGQMVSIGELEKKEEYSVDDDDDFPHFDNPIQHREEHSVTDAENESFRANVANLSDDDEEEDDDGISAISFTSPRSPKRNSDSSSVTSTDTNNITAANKAQKLKVSKISPTIST